MGGFFYDLLELRFTHFKFLNSKVIFCPLKHYSCISLFLFIFGLISPGICNPNHYSLRDRQ